MASDGEIERAFRAGNNDDDESLSVSEASQALLELSGKNFDASTIESACSSVGVDTSREMSFSEFKEVVRHLEGAGAL